MVVSEISELVPLTLHSYIKCQLYNGWWYPMHVWYCRKRKTNQHWDTAGAMLLMQHSQTLYRISLVKSLSLSHTQSHICDSLVAYYLNRPQGAPVLLDGGWRSQMFKSMFQVVQFHKSLFTNVWYVHIETIIYVANKCFAHQDTLLGTNKHVNCTTIVIYTFKIDDPPNK